MYELIVDMEISDHTKLQLLNLLSSTFSEPRHANIPLIIAPYCNILFTASHQSQEALPSKLSDAQEEIAHKAIASLDGSAVSLVPFIDVKIVSLRGLRWVRCARSPPFCAAALYGKLSLCPVDECSAIVSPGTIFFHFPCDSSQRHPSAAFTVVVLSHIADVLCCCTAFYHPQQGASWQLDMLK